MGKLSSIVRTDEREERFGKAKYGPEWIVLSDDDTGHVGKISNAKDVPREQLERGFWWPLHGELGAGWNLKLARGARHGSDLPIYSGAFSDREAAQRAWERAFAKKDQVENVREMLRLLERYKPGLARRPNGRRKIDPLEKIDSGDDRAKLEEARDIYWHIYRQQSAPKLSTGRKAARLKEALKAEGIRDRGEMSLGEIAQRVGPKLPKDFFASEEALQKAIGRALPKSG